MKTLLSINNYYYLRGGAEFVFLRHNDLLQNHGWRVVPFAMQHPRNRDTQWDRFFVDEIEYAHGYGAVDKLMRVSKAIYSFEARRKIGQVIAAAKPDVAHCHNIYHHLSPAILSVLKKHGVKTVMTLHDLKIACPAYTMLTHDGVCERCRKNRVYNVLLHRCMKGSAALSALVMVESGLHRLLDSYMANVDRFVVPSRFYKNKFAEWGFDRRRFVHIPNFIELDHYTPASAPASDEPKKRSVLYFGRLDRPKGLKTLIKSVCRAGLPLQIAGTGPEEKPLKKYARASGADVTFRGFLSGDELHDAIRQALVTVLPSEWYENAPVSILESYALGTAVIGADIGGIPELIRNGRTGFTFDSGSADSLADRLIEMKRMPHQQAAAMGREGRRWVEESFSSAAYLRRIERLYSELNN